MNAGPQAEKNWMKVAAIPYTSAKALAPNSRRTTIGLSVVTCPIAKP